MVRGYFAGESGPDPLQPDNHLGCRESRTYGAEDVHARRKAAAFYRDFRGYSCLEEALVDGAYAAAQHPAPLVVTKLRMTKRRDLSRRHHLSYHARRGDGRPSNLPIRCR